MAVRTRDKVWMVALTKTIRVGEWVRPGEIATETGVSERTVREVLNVMSDNGWLQRAVDDDSRVKFRSPEGIEDTT
jgi:DNA-binding GntR family transcriptional regulator